MQQSACCRTPTTTHACVPVALCNSVLWLVLFCRCLACIAGGDVEDAWFSNLVWACSKWEHGLEPEALAPLVVAAVDNVANDWLERGRWGALRLLKALARQVRAGGEQQGTTAGPVHEAASMGLDPNGSRHAVSWMHAWWIDSAAGPLQPGGFSCMLAVWTPTHYRFLRFLMQPGGFSLATAPPAAAAALEQRLLPLICRDIELVASLAPEVSRRDGCAVSALSATACLPARRPQHCQQHVYHPRHLPAA